VRAAPETGEGDENDRVVFIFIFIFIFIFNVFAELERVAPTRK
jgi:hypothetical protein